jgi:hypothetical protein
MLTEVLFITGGVFDPLNTLLAAGLVLVIFFVGLSRCAYGGFPVPLAARRDVRMAGTEAGVPENMLIRACEFEVESQRFS